MKELNKDKIQTFIMINVRNISMHIIDKCMIQIAYVTKNHILWLLVPKIIMIIAVIQDKLVPSLITMG